MNRLAAVLVASLLAACATQPPRPILEAAAERAVADARYHDSIVDVNGSSGVIVEWNGAYGVLTAWHVVVAGRGLYFKIAAGGVEQQVGPFKRVGGRTDVAWCRMASLPPQWKPLHVVSGQSESFGECTAWGYPGKYFVVMPCVDQGRINHGLFQIKNPDGVFRLFGGIASPGMSGGPIIDRRGYVVALVSHTGYPSKEEHYATEIPANDPPRSR